MTGVVWKVALNVQVQVSALNVGWDTTWKEILAKNAWITVWSAQIIMIASNVTNGEDIFQVIIYVINAQSNMNYVKELLNYVKIISIGSPILTLLV